MAAAASKLLPYLFRYRRRFAVGSVFLIGATAIQVLTPWVLKYAVDDLAAGIAARDAAAGAWLGLYAGAIIGMACGGGVCRFLMRRIIIGASREIEYDLRNAFFAHLQRLPLAYFQAHRTGDLMSRATNDLSAVRLMAGPAVMYTATTSVTFVAALTLMLSISPSLTLLALLPLPIVSIVVKRFGDAIYRRSERIQAQLAHLSAVVQEALAGVRVVRAYCREQVEIDRFREANREYVARNREMIQIQGVFHPSLGLFLGLSAVVVLWIGSRQVIEGRLTVGELVAFNAYVAMLSWPMIAFGWVTNMLQRGMAAWRRMLDVLEVEPAVPGPPAAGAAGAAGDTDAASAAAGPAVGGSASRSVVALRGQIEFRNLTFAYNGRNVLTDVSARIEPGQVLALVGPTGSGKSTLVDLLPRLFEPPPGTVFVDGVDVRELPLPVLRGAIGYVPQEAFLFSTTVAENVAFGAVDAGALTQGPSERAAVTGELRSAVEVAAGVAQLDGDLRTFPRGFRDDGGGARHYALRGTEATRRPGAGAGVRPADSHSRRRALRRRHANRGSDRVAVARRDAPAHVDHRVAPHLDRARRRSHPGARRRPRGRARHPRRAGLTGRTVRRALSEAAPGAGPGRRRLTDPEPCRTSTRRSSARPTMPA